MKDFNLLVIFLTGLLTGGLTCLAVQGGLLASTIAQREEERMKEKLKDRLKAGHALPILSFVLAKLAAYTVLGFLLGALGSFFKLSITAQVVLQIAVSLFMIGTALALVDAHPFFRYFIIQPPKFLTKRVRSQSKSGSLFAPAILGAFTIFIPCGTTQAMMALAVSTGSALLGASVMFAFILGTTPVFFILGYFAARLSDALHKKFLKVAAWAIILLAIFNINNAVALAGSQTTLGSLVRASFCSVAYCGAEGSGGSAGNVQAAVSEQTIEISNNGYSPRNFTVKAGSAVKLNLVNKDGWSCAQAFTIPRLGIQKVVRPGQSETVAFTAPSSPGQITFSCSMGMYQGVINVVD
ncbi:MAG: sulfite exporter TauE/SafE family protein [Patescibacteria group bacterium]|nr:sulfite exporter TauE/SafE family protein [Patescibacteria group bacterium]